MLESGLSAPDFLKNEWILIKLAQIYCLSIDKNWLDFCDLDRFPLTHEVLEFWKMACLHHISLKVWLDFGQTCIDILLTWAKEVIVCWRPLPYFQDVECL